jgi:hypothetical protein
LDDSASGGRQEDVTSAIFAILRDFATQQKSDLIDYSHVIGHYDLLMLILLN